MQTSDCEHEFLLEREFLFLVGDEDLEEYLNTYSKEDFSEAIYIFCVAK